MLRRPSGRDWRAGHADHAAWFAFGLGSPSWPSAASDWTRSDLRHQQRRRDPVDRISCADPFADDGISSFAQSGERRPRRVRQPSRCLGQIDDGRAVGPPQQVDHHAPACCPLAGASAWRRSPTSSGLRLWSRSGRGCGCGVSLGSIASSDPSSTAMAFKPAAVSLSA